MVLAMQQWLNCSELPFGTMSEAGARNRVAGGRAHWRRLANTIEHLCMATRPFTNLFSTILL